MNLGTLNVLLKATGVAQFHSSLGKAIDQVDKVARQVKRAGNDIAQAGLGLAGIAAGAVAMAATVDKGIAREVRNLKNAFTDLAVPIAQLLVPAMRSLADGVRAVADFVAGLSPRTRELIVQFIQIAAAVGAAALVFSKVAAAIEGVAGVLALITSGPFLAVAFALTLVLALVLVLHKAWRENWGGMQDKVRSVAETISGYWAAFADWFKGTFLDTVIDVWATVEKVIAKVGIAAKIATGQMDLGQWGAAVRRAEASVDSWAEKMKGGGLMTAVVDLGEKLKDGFVDAAGALKDELQIVMAKLGLDKLFESGGGKAKRHDGPKVSSANPADVSGMGAIANLSMQAAQQRIDAAASVLADNIKTNSAFLDRSLRFAAAERARVESTFVGRIARAAEEIGAALSSQGRSIASKFGALGSIIDAGVQGMASGGPWGAVIGILLELFSNLATAMKVVGKLMEIFGRGLERIDKLLGPIFEIFGTIAETVEFLTECLEGLFNPLTYIGIIFEAIGKTVSGTQLALMLLWRGIMQLTGQNTSKLTEQINALEAKQKKWSFDPAGKIEDGTGKIEDLGNAAAKAADKFDEMLTNMPSGYKIKGAQFGADGAGGLSAATGGPLDFSSVGFDPGNLLGGQSYDGVFNEYGTMGDTQPSMLPGSTEESAAMMAEAERLMQIFLAAFIKAMAEGMTEEAAAQAAELARQAAANGGGQNSIRELAKAIANQSATELKRTSRNGAF